MCYRGNYEFYIELGVGRKNIIGEGRDEIYGNCKVKV